MKVSFYFFISILCLLSISFTACEDEPELSPEQELTLSTNNWIFDVMDEVYFWTDEMPTDIDKNETPTDYFNALLHREDRFSRIFPDFEVLLSSLNGVFLEAGYEFTLVKTGETEVVAVITYVKENSPADDASLKRGDIITEVNDQAMTISNYSEVASQIFDDHSIKFLRYQPKTEAYEEQAPVALNVVQYSENPNFLDTVYTIDSKKIGYYIYNFFSDGASGNEFDSEVDQIFTGFKSENITDLILDLRYNGGGNVQSAINLASHLAPNVTSNDIFVRNQWNDFYTNVWQNHAEGEDQLKIFFTEESANIGDNISGNIYILTGKRTASASELIINGLDPYMNVTIIGDTTVGKNVGSIPFEDSKNPDNTYGILPIVIKLANKDGYSGYDNGFVPLGDNLVSDIQFPMTPLGDINEPLLARAVELITGQSTGGRKGGSS
ncbi:MAG: S41 family peptidase, partial [Fulvivirga sp.]|nr:S41 family peptidase [Fulvivirga sp.]